MPITDDLSCKEFVELVTAYLDEVLPEDVRACVEAHLQVCDGCQLYLGQMRLTIRALALQRDGGLSPQARERLLGQFAAWRASRPT